MQGDQLTWHWEIPNANPFAHGIDLGFRAGFAGDKAPKKAESDAETSAYEAGVAARNELRDDSRHFSELRVYLTGDDHVAYALTERSD